MGLRYKITVFKLDSKGKERIIKCEIFDNREDADIFLQNQKSEIRPYKINNKKDYHILEAL
jgi:hypothetical protein